MVEKKRGEYGSTLKETLLIELSSSERKKRRVARVEEVDTAAARRTRSSKATKAPGRTRRQ